MWLDHRGWCQVLHTQNGCSEIGVRPISGQHHLLYFVLSCSLLPLQKLSSQSLPPLPLPALTTSTYFDGFGRVPTPVYMLDDLVGGQQLDGPALLIDNIR